MSQTQDGKQLEDLQGLQRRLDSKIRIISPAIDMIELITARGNTSLESCVSLTKSLRADIQDLGNRLASAASDEEASRRKGSKASSKHSRDWELQVIIAEMKVLLQRLEDAVPLINLAITTSGVSLSTTLPASISPSRLLQASTFISAGDAAFVESCPRSTQIGPAFTLSMYMLFQGHASNLHDEEGLRHATWQEVVHKARVKLVRTPINRLGQFHVSTHDQQQSSSDTPITSMESEEYFPVGTPQDEFAYQLTLIEDLDDDRVHTFEDDQTQPGPFDDVNLAGMREVIPVHQISRIFYADTGKILNINTEGESNSPILLLKRDIHAIPPRKMMSAELYDTDGSAIENTMNRTHATGPGDVHTPSEHHAQPQRSQWQLPPGLDPEWIALEVYVEEPDSDTASESARDESPGPRPQTSQQYSTDTRLTAGLSSLRLSSSPSPGGARDSTAANGTMTNTPSGASLFPANFNSFLTRSGAGIRTSLSLLEMLIRLTSLQQFQQASHLTINDELLNFFLVESSNTGATGNTDQRKRVRIDARQKVGFDPYNESPIKRHGEQYQYQQNGASRETSRASTPSISQATSQTFDSPPIVMRNRELLSKTRAGTPETPTRSPVSFPLQRTPVYDPSRQSLGSLVTPPGMTKSREAFLREEASHVKEGKSSPLARESSSSDEDYTDT